MRSIGGSLFLGWSKKFTNLINGNALTRPKKTVPLQVADANKHIPCMPMASNASFEFNCEYSKHFRRLCGLAVEFVAIWANVVPALDYVDFSRSVNGLGTLWAWQLTVLGIAPLCQRFCHHFCHHSCRRFFHCFCRRFCCRFFHCHHYAIAFSATFATIVCQPAFICFLSTWTQAFARRRQFNSRWLPSSNIISYRSSLYRKSSRLLHGNRPHSFAFSNTFKSNVWSIVTAI